MNNFELGEKMMREMGLYPSEAMAEAMQSLSPTYWQNMIEDVGMLYSRPTLDLKMREVVTLSTLVTMGCALPQLKVHIRAALHVGLTQAQINEIILQLVIYCGYPKTINALSSSKRDI